MGLFRYLAVVVNVGMRRSGLLMPINVSGAWMEITIIGAACCTSRVCQMFIDGVVIA